MLYQTYTGNASGMHLSFTNTRVHTCTFILRIKVRINQQDWLFANVSSDVAAFNVALLCLRQVYRWTGDNMFFIKGDMDSLAFGGGRCVRNA